MITKSDLELICNYSESAKASYPVAQLHYLEFIKEYSEEVKLSKKRINRDLAIDAILDNKVEEFNKNRDSQSEWTSIDDTITSISPKMMSINVSGYKFTDMNNLWDIVISNLESMTSVPMNIKSNGNNQLSTISISNDPNLTSAENFQTYSRRIVSRIQMLSNRIAADSYRGPGTSIICGLESIHYIIENPMFQPNKSGESIGNLYGLNVVVSNRIKSNKVIVLRSGQKIESGLNVVTNSNDSRYFMVSTPGSWENCITWFEII